MATTDSVFMLSPDFLAGFLMPFSVSLTGLLFPVMFFEWAVRQPYFQKYHITYKSDQRRYQNGSYAPKHLSSVSSFDEYQKMGIQRAPITAFFCSAIIYSLQLEMFSPQALYERPENWKMLVQYVAYYYLSDLIAFVNHYAVHKNDFLWKHVHSMHHEVHTPTAFSGPYSTFYDYFMFGGVPNILSVAILRPHALVFYLGLLTNTYGVAYVHSGIQHPIFDSLMCLGGLIPFHATPRLHDRHHRRAGRKAVDMGEHIWLWDYIAGTLTEGFV